MRTNTRTKRNLRVRSAPAVSFTVYFDAAPEGGYTVTCPALPGLVTEGDTLREARAMAKDAISGHLEALLLDGQPIPSDNR